MILISMGKRMCSSQILVVLELPGMIEIYETEWVEEKLDEVQITKKAKKIEREKEIADYETIIMGMKIRVKLILLLMFHAQT